MSQRNESTARHWSTDFVGHVRTINFSLVAVCVALLGLLRFEKPTDVATAQTQLEEMKALVDKWPDSSSTVLSLIQVSRGFIDPGRQFLKRIEILGQPFLLESNGSSSIVVAGRNGPPNMLPKKPTSLSEFGAFWSLLGQMQIKTVSPAEPLGDKVVIIHKDGSATSLKYVATPAKLMVGPPVVYFKEDPIGDAEQRIMSSELGIVAEPYAYSWTRGEDRLILPIKKRSEQLLNAQEALIATHPYWKLGSFSDSFHELDDATIGIQGKSFEELKYVLAQEAAKPKVESFELFGVKFPVATARLWGVGAIFVIQLYLWIHLHELSPRLKADDPGWDVAWIGVYRSRLARCLFAVTAGVLPLCTAVLLDYKALRGANFWVWIIHIALLLSILVLSILIIRWAPQRVTTS
jgi:hypothetical protein